MRVNFSNCNGDIRFSPGMHHCPGDRNYGIEKSEHIMLKIIPGLSIAPVSYGYTKFLNAVMVHFFSLLRNYPSC